MNTRMPQTRNTESVAENLQLRRLDTVLRAAEVRFKLREAAWYVPISAALGLLATLVIALAWRLKGDLPLLILLCVGVLGVVLAILTTSLYAFLHPRDHLQTARRADHFLALDERLATALEASNRATELTNPAQEEMRRAQLDDTLLSATAISMRRTLPVTWQSRRFLPAGLLVLILMAAAFGPNPFAGGDRAVQAQIAQEQQKIQAIEQVVKASPQLAQDPSLQALLKELSDLSRVLSSADLKREEAVARLSDSEEKLKKSLDAGAKSERAALDALAKQLSASGNADAKQIGDALKSGDPQKSSDALKAAAANADKVSPQGQKALSDALKQARDNIAALDPETARLLSDASDALSANDAQATKKALGDLGQHIADTAQKLATQQQVSQALSQLQQSKQNIAQAGEPTSQPVHGTAIANTTPDANGTPPPNGTSAANSTPFTSGTSIAQVPLTSQPVSGTPRAETPVALGSPTQGQLPRTGTPLSPKPNSTPSPGAGGTSVAVQGTAGTGSTPVAIQGQGQQGQGQQGGNPQPGQGTSSSSSQGNNGQWGTGHQEPVYAPPSSLSVTVTPVVISGQTNPGGEQGNVPVNGGATIGQAQVPYEQVFGQYQKQAGSALNSDYIPQGYKDLVRDYFSELEPVP